MAFAAATRTGSWVPSPHFRMPPSPVEMRSSSAARDMERYGARPAGTATETSPAGNHSSNSSLKSAMLDSSPLKVTAAWSFPVSGSRAAVAVARAEPPRGSFRLIFSHGQMPSFGKPRHSASAPLLVVRRRPASPQEAPSTSPTPSMPRSANGKVSLRREPSGCMCMRMPSCPRERATSEPVLLEAINDGCCFEAQFMSVRCSSFCTGTSMVVGTSG
mmetsp:Transcript_59466/g.159260  ORF Transcript_59466/g.159260 Transcript_59466/m.159260 type:complete len:217 (+) Transcript_59466:210-860(+)